MSTPKKPKRTKGIPVHWDTLKHNRTLTLTDDVWNELKRQGVELGISRSELIERIIRSKYIKKGENLIDSSDER